MRGGDVGGERAGSGATTDAVFGPRSVALTGQRGRLRGQLVAVVTPGGGKKLEMCLI